MKIIADLQLHSKYSRATSAKMDIAHIWEWARLKGIGLVATGDWTHPLWIREIKANLEEDGSGLLRLKDSSGREIFSGVNSPPKRRLKQPLRSKISSPSESSENNPRFLLATEISSIYTQGGKTRRIHNLVWAPSVSVVEKINNNLNRRGCNLASDGRPIVGLTSEEIVELVLGVEERCLIIPAHVWTPWFSLYGSKSGFDSIKECFGKYAKYIYAIETGLSSDPLMNWQINDLDNRAIISSSDAHSGPKIGREATVFDLEKLSYEAVRAAIVGEEENKIACTFEFYPEEGKYHFTGHRNCGIKQNPAQTKKKGRICPVCGQSLTVGVMHRVQQLAGREIKNEELKIKSDKFGVRWIYHPQSKKPPFVNLVPLLEIISEVLGTASYSKKVFFEYKKLTEEIGSEFYILLKSDLEKVKKFVDFGEKLAEAIAKVRAGEIYVEPGFDGVFGKVKIWGDERGGGAERGGEEEKEQLGLF